MTFGLFACFEIELQIMNLDPGLEFKMITSANMVISPVFHFQTKFRPTNFSQGFQSQLSMPVKTGTIINIQYKRTKS